MIKQKSLGMQTIAEKLLYISNEEDRYVDYLEYNNNLYVGDDWDWFLCKNKN